MMKRYFLIIFLLTGASFSLAQEITFDQVKKLYEAFDYDNVIKLSDQLIKKADLSDSLLIEIHLMRANVFYSNGDEISTRKSFENILKIKKNYSPDPSHVSPKLISIFNEVKSEFFRNNPEKIVSKDSTQQKQETIIDQRPIKSAVIKNLLLPGLGQLHFGSSTKGWILTSASALNLGAMVYFIFDAKSKGDAYLKETDQILIQQKYTDYNKSYKLRNALIISYAVIWLYSQIDLLFFSNEQEVITSPRTTNFINTNQPATDFQLSFQIPIN